MKASSFRHHIWVGCFICALFLFLTGVAYADGGDKVTLKAHTCENANVRVLPLQKPIKNKSELSAVVSQAQAQAPAVPLPAKETDTAKTAPKQAEIKKQESTSGFVSFNFLYYLFYKTNFAEATNSALRSSWNVLIGRILG